TRVHDRGAAFELADLLLVREPVHDQLVRLERTGSHFAQVVHEQYAPPANFEAVWRFIELDAHPLRGERLEPLALAVVAAEHAGERNVQLEKWRERERRAIITSMQDHPHATVDHSLKQLANRRDTVVRVRHQPDEHQSTLHSGSSSSGITR